ncbi:urokinase plasminogen activator surface receptor-like isoform X2 [Lepisosteus oculatus]
MRLLAILLALWELFHSVSALTCLRCDGTGAEPCTPDEQECAPRQKCASVTELRALENVSRTILTKTCIDQEQCGHNSLTTVGFSRAVNAQCCSTDKCNTDTAPVSERGMPNGLVCAACYSTSGQCGKNTVECLGSENRCFLHNETNYNDEILLKGCISQDICRSEFLFLRGSGSVSISCCTGHLCNTAPRLGEAGLFLFLVASLAAVFVV